VLVKTSLSENFEIAVSSRFYVVRVLVLTGAGVSAESGIPTFRGKDGYWRNLDPTKLATVDAFARDPQLVWDWYRERRQRISAARPNAAHEAIARLSHHTDDFLLVTQNVDDLHARGGVLAKKMVQIHGDIFTTRCSRCDWRSELRDAETNNIRNHTGLAGARPSTEGNEKEDAECDLPICPNCTALMRPGVVWFDEQLPWNEVERVETFLDGGACDVVVVAGTTATFGYIIDWALRGSQGGRNLIEVNLEETPLSRFATRLVREPATIAMPRIVDLLLDSRCSKL
jgi:NAD-dependent deacetylase